MQASSDDQHPAFPLFYRYGLTRRKLTGGLKIVHLRRRNFRMGGVDAQ